MESLLEDIHSPVLVLAGGEDHILPSVDEAVRLSEVIPKCQQVGFIFHRGPDNYIVIHHSSMVATILAFMVKEKASRTSLASPPSQRGHH